MFKVSNRHEIEEELARDESRLAILCRTEKQRTAATEQTVTIQPSCGDEMQSLREECSQLRIILEAMEASED